MDHSTWLESYLQKVAACSEEGRLAVEYVRANKTKVGFKRARRSVGAFWTIWHGFYLNSRYHTPESSLEQVRAWTLFVHEVRHLQQGPITALSIYGELDAWQYEFRLFQKITGQQLKPVLQEILALPLNFDRQNLRHAQRLMNIFAGPGYLAWILPLYPITSEIRYWVTRRQA